MKTLVRIFALGFLLTACAQQGKNNIPQEPIQTESPAPSQEKPFNEQEKSFAKKLSKAYVDWRQQCADMENSGQSEGDENTQAFIFGFNAIQNLDSNNVEVLNLVLQKFMTIKNTDPESKEMLLLARAVIEMKEKQL